MQYIFHADDDATDRADLKNIFSSLDPSLQVIGFDNGLDMMQHLGIISSNNYPDMIFLDLRMPIWDGIRTLRALQFDSRFCGIPIYMWSISDTKNEMDLCLRLGALEFITKPTVSNEWWMLKHKLKSFVNQVAI
jgi:CheY-like chemotaxis protein